MYEIDVRPQIERIDLIQNRKENTTRELTFHEYQNTRYELPIVRLPISLPIYRMANYRTKTRQQSYIKQNGKPIDFFKIGQENIEAQQAQHDILVQLAKKGIEGSITPIIEVLEQDVQKDPLLLTYDGVVVNGNRRLAAMRYLYSEKNKNDFEYIECAILPKDATEDEIRDVEVRLQMQPHTELPYEWIVEAIAARELMEIKGSDKEVADLMRVRPIDIKDKVFSLELVDDYLTRWLKEPESYDLVEDKEQWFSELAKRIRKNQPEEKQLAQTVAYILTEKSSLLPGRLYDYRNAIGKFLSDIAKKLAEKKGIDLEVTYADSDSLFGGEDTEPIFSYAPLVDTIEKVHETGGENEDSLLIEIKEIFEESKEKADDKTKGEHAKNKVVAANTALQAVDLSEANPQTYMAIKSQLETIEQLVTNLKTDLAELMKND